MNISAFTQKPYRNCSKTINSPESQKIMQFRQFSDSLASVFEDAVLPQT